MTKRDKASILSEVRLLLYVSNSAFRGKMNMIDISAVRNTGKKKKRKEYGRFA